MTGDLGMVYMTVFIDADTTIEVDPPTETRPTWVLSLGHYNTLTAQTRDRAAFVRLRDALDPALAEPEADR